jgi:hypothetical protein
MKGAPCSELTVRFQFLYMRCDELARLLLGFEQLYNRILQVLRGIDANLEMPPEERLRVSRCHLDMEGVLTLRGAICTVDVDGEQRDLGVLDVIRDLYLDNACAPVEEHFQTLQHIREHKTGVPIDYDQETVPANKEASLVKVQQELEEYKQRFESQARISLPMATEADVAEIATLAYQVSSELFQRRNVWGLEVQ